MNNKTVEILDVGPRDGLQNEATLISTEDKIALVTRLMEAGIRRLEVASFVHPKMVPQMADAETVVAGLPVRGDTTFIGLVLNMRGAERAAATRTTTGAVIGAGIDELGCVAVASDSFGKENQAQSSAESIAVSNEIVAFGKSSGMSAQVTISAAFGCPFEGEIEPGKVVDIARKLAEAEPREIALADTIGVAVPAQVTELFGMVAEAVPGLPLRAHFHNTRNTGIANALAAFEAGAATIDASVGGLGGCPFAPKATGNIGTEDLVYLLDRSGIDSGVDLDKLIEAARWVEDVLGRPNPAMVSRAGVFPKTAD